MEIRVGTSGFSYKEWKGVFYPEKIKPAEMLGFYAEHFGSVEINNTFYRMPTVKLLEGWAAQVPATFRFVLKVPRRITHSKKLADVGDEMKYLLETAGVLGTRLGPMLFQLPPFFKQDIARLRDFLATLPDDFLAAFEFRNASWFDDETYEALREHNQALVLADTDKGEPPMVATADWGYLRLRRVHYDDAAIAAWVARVQAMPWKQAGVFFKHEDKGTGPTFGRQFLTHL